jgi:hypothetical protein
MSGRTEKSTKNYIPGSLGHGWNLNRAPPEYRLRILEACNETNLIHYLSSDYSVTTTLHDSALLVAHHQEAEIQDVRARGI